MSAEDNFALEQPFSTEAPSQKVGGSKGGYSGADQTVVASESSQAHRRAFMHNLDYLQRFVS